LLLTSNKDNKLQALSKAKEKEAAETERMARK
jgi:hypothetical protein